MRSLVKVAPAWLPLILLLWQVPQAFAAPCEFAIGEGVPKGPWVKLLGSMQWTEAEPGNAGDAKIIVVNGAASLPVIPIGSIIIVEGSGPASQTIGVVPKGDSLSVRQVRDEHSPETAVIWEEPATIPIVTVPSDFQIFAAEKWKHAPVLAGKRVPTGAVLWLATSPGTDGFERYPYLLQALMDLGVESPFRSSSLWAFFDSSYRIRADVDYLAKRWRQAGIGTLHVAAWHNMDEDPAADDYLIRLIQACHRHSIRVYAWLELPHVSEKFWADHPNWREQTAVGQDAQLDWRKLMNLQNAACHSEVSRQINRLLSRFNWDGVNLAELYFESLEGPANPARFTPMNADVRREFKRIASVDPKSLFDPKIAGTPARTQQQLRQFLEYRAALAARMQADWLAELEGVRKDKPYLDLVLTHIDDRFDPAIRDLLGADVQKSLPILQAHDATLLVEDPATLWNLGPERYAKLSAKYAEIVPHAGSAKLAVDLNIVDRYQDVYPTKKQVGSELLELVHSAANGFATVAIYFENSVDKQDLALLPIAAAQASFGQSSRPDELEIDASAGTRLHWQGAVEIDGKPWPIQDRDFVSLPAGKHRVTAGFGSVPVPILDFNGDVQRTTISGQREDLTYNSRGRALLQLGVAPSKLEVDGKPWGTVMTEQGDLSANRTAVLPAGQHTLSLTR